MTAVRADRRQRLMSDLDGSAVNLAVRRSRSNMADREFLPNTGANELPRIIARASQRASNTPDIYHQLTNDVASQPTTTRLLHRHPDEPRAVRFSR